MEEIETWLAAEDAVMAEMAEAIEDMLTAFMDEAVSGFATTGQFIPPGGNAISLLVDVLANGWEPAIKLGVERQPKLIQQKTDITPRALVEYARTYGVQRANQIVSTTGKQLRDLVITGQRQGLSRLEIGKLLINKVPRLAAVRAKIIAETEIHSAAQFGSYNAAIRSGKSLLKVWNTVGDERVRAFQTGAKYSHRAMNQRQIALSGYFAVPSVFGSSENLLFPGDPNGSAGNIINCRCIMTYKET